MCKENSYAEIEKQEGQICRCTRQGLNLQTPGHVYLRSDGNGGQRIFTIHVFPPVFECVGSK